MKTEGNIRSYSHTKCPICKKGELEFIGIMIDSSNNIYRKYGCCRCNKKFKVLTKFKPKITPHIKQEEFDLD